MFSKYTNQTKCNCKAHWQCFAELLLIQLKHTNLVIWAVYPQINSWWRPLDFWGTSNVMSERSYSSARPTKMES